MYEQERINPYDKAGDKKQLVAAMFDHIAPTYDTLNHRMSWNIDRYWRKKSILQLHDSQPKRILDIATGTGDFAILAAKMLHPKSVIGADISEGMMNIAKQKVEKEGLQDIITFQLEDCKTLSFDDNSFDAVTSSFGIRNFADLDKSLTEICRVLKPGGKLSIVELSHPTSFPMKQLFKVYSHVMLPIYGQLISKEKGANKYLRKTIEAFPQGEQMTAILQKAGFNEVAFKRMTFGICTMYIAKK